MEHCKYSVIVTETYEYENNRQTRISTPHWELLEIFDTLKEAKDYQVECEDRFRFKTIIIPTY